MLSTYSYAPCPAVDHVRPPVLGCHPSFSLRAGHIRNHFCRTPISDIRGSPLADLHHIGDIDRSEEVRVGYEMRDGSLRRIDVHWDVPPWRPDGEGDHTVPAKIAFCRDHMDRGTVSLRRIRR